MCNFVFVFLFFFVFFFFKQKTAYEIRNCDWSSDVCSSDLYVPGALGGFFIFFFPGECFAFRDYAWKAEKPNLYEDSMDFKPAAVKVTASLLNAIVNANLPPQIGRASCRERV